jgi:hypothetical protein
VLFPAIDKYSTIWYLCLSFSHALRNEVVEELNTAFLVVQPMGKSEGLTYLWQDILNEFLQKLMGMTELSQVASVL